MKIDNIAIVGSGNIASFFYKILNGNVSKLELISRSNNADFETKITSIDTQYDLVILAISDSAIENIAQKLNKSLNVVHCAGSVSLSALSEFSNYGVIYPLQSIHKDRTFNAKDVPFLFEANNPSFKASVQKFIKDKMSLIAIEVNSEDRLKVHLAAVFANNFITYLMNVSEEIILKTNIDFEMLKPLIFETINNYFKHGYEKSQTGPARRNDVKTINKHLNLIASQPVQTEMYKLFTQAIIEKFKA